MKLDNAAVADFDHTAVNNRMNSIVPECNPLKHKYDDCFHTWFTTKFLANRHGGQDPCGDLLKEYQECTHKALKAQGIDLAEVHTRVLGTETDKSKSHPGGKPATTEETPPSKK